jgi:hypothetical protein
MNVTACVESTTGSTVGVLIRRREIRLLDGDNTMIRRFGLKAFAGLTGELDLPEHDVTLDAAAVAQIQKWAAGI